MNKPNLSAKAAPSADRVATGSSPKLSATLFAFGEPLLSKLGEDAPLPVQKHGMQLVITAWNAGAMALPEWGEPELLRQLEQALTQPATASPMRAVLQQLLRQRREVFGADPRAVGEWTLTPEPKAGCVLRCVAHLPAGAAHARPARVDAVDDAEL